MSGRGIVEAETWRSQQIEAAERTTDPPNAPVGDMWVRPDIKPSIDNQNVTTLGALRIQGSGGVLQVPLINLDDSPYLGPDVYVGPQFYFGKYANDGISGSAVGFVPVTDQGGAKGSPRVITPAGVEYEAHDGVELSAIPDSGIARHEFEGDYSDSWSGSVSDFSGLGNGTEFTSTSAVGSQAVEFDAGDNVSLPTPPDEIWDSGSVALRVDFDNTSTDKQFPVGLGDIDADRGTGRELRLSDVGTYDFIGHGADVNTGTSPNSGFDFIVYTWDSDGDVTVYRDDANVIGSATGLSLNTPDNTPAWYYGVSARGPAANDNFAGIIDDPRLYNKELSSNEVSNLYNTGSI